VRRPDASTDVYLTANFHEGFLPRVVVLRVPDPRTVGSHFFGITLLNVQVTPGLRHVLVLVEASKRGRRLAWTASFHPSGPVFGAQGAAQDGVDDNDE
jgi:hypothetical protein